MIPAIPPGPGTGPRRRRIRFSWRAFGLALSVIIIALVGLAIARMCAGWENGAALETTSKVTFSLSGTSLDGM